MTPKPNATHYCTKCVGFYNFAGMMPHHVESVRCCGQSVTKIDHPAVDAALAQKPASIDTPVEGVEHGWELKDLL